MKCNLPENLTSHNFNDFIFVRETTPGGIAEALKAKGLDTIDFAVGDCPDVYRFQLWRFIGIFSKFLTSVNSELPPFSMTFQTEAVLPSKALTPSFVHSESDPDIAKKDPSIYDMKLHSQMESGPWTIFRVASGWIYQKTKSGDLVDSHFVPYDNHFQM